LNWTRIVSTGICRAFVAVFVPSNSSLDTFRGIPTYMATTKKKSYVSSIVGAARTYSISGTSTQSFPTIQLAGIQMSGSTSSKVLIFATSTIDRYYTASYRNFFRNLVLFSLYLTCGMMLWKLAEQYIH